MGQGGSAGTMNDTRIISPLEKDQEIGQQARWVWELFSGSEYAWKGHNCHGSKKRVMGWSTGGLAGYRLAYEQWPQEVVLIAPGIHVKAMVGEAAGNWMNMFMFRDTITFRTLTRNTAAAHVDPVRPTTPATIPLFAANLVTSSLKSQAWKIPKNVRGLVFLSGIEDSYVERDKIFRTLRANASHFAIQVHNGSLHEMDNELPPVASDVRERTVKFFGE
jgi:hypothetical protein